jgi:hypothetical protein
MVFMGNGGAKQGHNAVAEHLVDGTLEAVHGVHHAMDGGVEELLGGFGVEATNQLSGVFDIGKQHGDLLAFTGEGGASSQNLVGEIGWRVGQRGTVWGWRRSRDRRSGRGGVTRPDEHCTVLIHRQFLCLNNFGLEVVGVCIIQAKLALQGPVGDPPLTLQQLNDLGQHLKKSHCLPPLRRHDGGRPSRPLATILDHGIR